PLEPVEPLVRSENAWTPRLKKEKEVNPSEITSETRMAPEIVQRKVNSLLNKMTLEKFDKISGQILDIAAQSKYEDDGRTLRQVIELTFAKATDEAHWSSMYARFCQKMQEEIDPQIQDRSILDKEGLPVRSNMLFRKYLLSRCQAEFEKGWVDKIPTHDETTPTDAQSMSEDYYKAAAAKRRGLGLIKFIGELYMLDMITERIMHGCIQRLLMTETGPGEDPSEDLIESLSKLLTTIGEKLDASCRMTDWLEGYYAKMDKLTKSPTLPPRLRFMLMDVIDLRKHHWQSKNKEKGPKTIAEVHEDAAKAEQQKETARQQMQKNTSGRNNS
ncbi:ARM repeat-containing protein, partial [Nadsonia fulvescens var. elongata DSM 6958]